MGLDAPLLQSLHHRLESETTTSAAAKSASTPTRTYVRDAKSMAATPAAVKECPRSYVFLIDMPDLKSGDLRAQVEEDNMMFISGERKREEEKHQGCKYVRMGTSWIGEIKSKLKSSQN